MRSCVLVFPQIGGFWELFAVSFDLHFNELFFFPIPFQDQSLAMLDAQRWKAVQNQMLCDRDSEELVRLNDDIHAIVEITH
jgi:hypothetical protein